MSDDKRIAEDLEEFLDSPGSYAGGLDRQTEQVADALKKAARQPSPRAGFVNELAQQLNERNQELSDRSPGRVWQIGRRLVFAAAGLAAIVLFAFFVGGLFRQPEVEPAVSDAETPAPAIVRRASGGSLEGIEFQLTEPFPEQSGEVAVYEASVAGTPSRPEEVLALAEALGMQNPQLYEAQDSGQWTVLDDQGRTLRWMPVDDSRFSSEPGPNGSRPAQLLYSIDEVERLSPEGDPLPFEEAAQIAEEFLRRGGLLPTEYEIRDGQWIGATPLRLVEFHRLVNGYPLSGDQTTIRVMVLPDGTVSHASVLPLELRATGDTVSVRSAEEVFEEAISGSGGFGYSFETRPADAQQPQVYFPETAPPRPGDTVTLQGWLDVYRPVGGGNPRALFKARPDQTTYELSGSFPEGLLASSRGEVEITGIVESVPNAGPILLQARSWQPLGSAAQTPTCLVGTFRREGQVGRLEADDGSTLELAGVPQQVNDGQRVEVCGGFADSGDSLDWQSMVVPPPSENDAAFGVGAGGGGQLVAVEEVVQVTRTLEIESESSAPVNRGVQVAVPVPRPEGGDSPFEIGQEVSITGWVQGFRRNVEGEMRPLVQFMVDVDDDPLTPALPFPLQGEPQTLEEISHFYGLHLTIEGVIVPGEGEIFGPDRQSILVEDYRQPWPEEEVERFLGHMQTETIEGQTVTIFTDEQSGVRYVLAQGYGDPDPEERVWIVGVVHPQAGFAQMPLLRPIQVRMGSDVDAAESPSDIQFEPEMPVVEMGSLAPGGSSGLSQTLIIDRVVLGYSLNATRPAPEGETVSSSRALTPTWLFFGHSPDATTSFVLQVEAARR